MLEEGGQSGADPPPMVLTIRPLLLLLLPEGPRPSERRSLIPPADPPTPELFMAGEEAGESFQLLLLPPLPPP